MSKVSRYWGQVALPAAGTVEPGRRVCANCGGAVSAPGDPWRCPGCNARNDSREWICKLPAAEERALAVLDEVLLD